MSEWKCGKCEKEYTFDEFMELPKIRVKPEVEDPEREYGVTTVCYNCGYIFHKEKFRQRDTVTIWIHGKGYIVEVSTVFLELNHSGFYYETMIFPKEGQSETIDCNFQDRYKTQDEAMEGHISIIKKLRNGEYSTEVKSFELKIK